MARVYVSSTFTDLQAHREAVEQAVVRAGHVAVGLDSSGSSDQRPAARSLDLLAGCDVYIGLLAWRYGEIPDERNPQRRSITELEYQRARTQGIPTLMFLLSDDAPWPRSASDRDLTAVEAFRERVRREVVVGRFDGVDDLRGAVTQGLQALSRPGPGPGRTRLTLAVVHSERDERLISQVMTGLPQLVRPDDVTIRKYAAELPLAKGPEIWASDIVLLGLSPNLVYSGWFSGNDLRRMSSAAEAGTPQLVGLSLRAISFANLPTMLMLPASGRPLSEEKNRDAVVVEIAEAVGSIARAIRARRDRTSRVPLPVRQVHRMVDVFKESGVPTVTFVEPESFHQLRDALEQAGRGIVIEGPSGVGKTSALQTAVRNLDVPGQVPFEMLSARNHAHVERIADLPGWHSSPVAIDDFHRLDERTRTVVVDQLKLLADTEPIDRKLVVVGIPGTGRRLVEMSYDIATRITVIKLGTAADAKILEMVEKGEAALNVDLVHKTEIVRTAAGSLNIAQILCRHAVSLAGVHETMRSVTPVDTDMRRTTTAAVRMVETKFDTAVAAFASLDGPESRTCIELLGELAKADEGMLALHEVRNRRRDLRAGIDHVFGKGLAEHGTGTGNHLLFDSVSKSLVVDDPQFTFYLRQQNLERLADSVGKKPRRDRRRVFVSYSHADAEWLERLRIHLAPLERAGTVDVWSDKRIAAGSLWRDEIEEALGSAGVALLLVSPHFLASAFIVDNEIPPLLEAADSGGCRILTLPVRPSLLTDSPELSRYQAVIPPGRPLSAMAESEVDETLVTVARTLADAVRVS